MQSKWERSTAANFAEPRTIAAKANSNQPEKAFDSNPITGTIAARISACISNHSIKWHRAALIGIGFDLFLKPIARLYPQAAALHRSSRLQREIIDGNRYKPLYLLDIHSQSRRTITNAQGADLHALLPERMDAGSN
jgi:hypothetical protein